MCRAADVTPTGPVEGGEPLPQCRGRDSIEERAALPIDTAGRIAVPPLGSVGQGDAGVPGCGVLGTSGKIIETGEDAYYDGANVLAMMSEF